MRLNGWQGLSALVAAFIVSTTVLGCAESSTAPSAAGRMELTVTPTTVAYAGGVGVGGAVCPVGWPSRWGPFTWTLREVGGGTVTLTSFKWAVTTTAGNQIADDELGSSISSYFGTTASPLVVATNVTLTSRTIYDREDLAFPGGTARFTATGTNEAGSVVTSVATLTLLPPPS